MACTRPNRERPRSGPTPVGGRRAKTNAAASAREPTPSLRKIFATWNFTVFSPMPRFAAISRLR